MLKGDLDGAVDAFNHAIRINPEHANAYSSLGFAQECMGNLESSITSYATALRLDPDHNFARMNIINAHAKTNDQISTIESLERAVEAGTANAETWIKVMTARQSQGDEGSDPCSPAESSRFAFLHSDPRFIAAIERMGF